jgi:hypothetical protein
MFTRKTLTRLAAVTLVLWAIGIALGPDHDVLYVLDDVLFFAIIFCTIALVVLTVGTFVRSRRMVGG